MKKSELIGHPKQRETWKKHLLVPALTTVLLTSVLLTSASFLTGCEEKADLVSLTYDSEKDSLTDTKNGITYLWASVAYEPATVGDAYAKWDDKELYRVAGYDPTQILSEEYEGVGGLLYASTMTLPALADMDADTIYVCTQNVSTVCLSQIEDKDTVQKAVDALTNGEEAELPQDGTTTYYLKFLSDQYEGIYYNVLYVECSDQSRYLYDRSTKKCVRLTDDIFSGYLYDDGTDTADSNTEGNESEMVSADENGDVTITFGEQTDAQ